MKTGDSLMRRVPLALALLSAGVLACLVLAYLGLVPPWTLSSPPPSLRATLGEGERAEVSCLAFSPDGRTLAAGSQFTGKLRLWDVTTGANTATLSEFDGDVNGVAFSPDGGTLAAAVAEKGGGTAVRLWDVTTGK